MTKTLRRLRLLALLPLALSGCAINPVTGQRELVLISEAQEIQIGRDADPEITSQLGLYPDSAWQRYVQDIGGRMAARSERPNLPWTIRVLDDPVINAFALPGGYLYVTRGILAHFSSEAELAGVVGHEIGHITARHGVQQMTRQQLAQIGLGVGSILAPNLGDLAGAAGAGLGLLFLRYGRDAERQADDLGLAYMTTQNYDPREMAATFEMLYNASGGDEGDRLPGWLSSHPDPLERRDRILAIIAAGTVRGERVEREAYLQRLAGMMYGDNPRDGFFRDNTFHHPELAFRMVFPVGWATANQRYAVQGMSPQEDAAFVLTVEEDATARAARTRFLSAQGITTVSQRDDRVNGLVAAQAEFRAATQSGVLVGTVAFVEHRGNVYRLLGYAMESAWSARQAVLRSAVTSFRPETDQAILGVQPLRIELVRTPSAMTIETFHTRYPSPVSVQVAGTLNRFGPGVTIPTGTLMKRVVGNPVP